MWPVGGGAHVDIGAVITIEMKECKLENGVAQAFLGSFAKPKGGLAYRVVVGLDHKMIKVGRMRC